MHFESLADLFAMGGYGNYVWSAFAITFGSIAILAFNSVRAGKKILDDVKMKQERQARIDAAKNLENTL